MPDSCRNDSGIPDPSPMGYNDLVDDDGDIGYPRHHLNVNWSDGDALPFDMTFNEPALMSVVVYSLLFVVAAVGNLTVFVTLFRNRRRRSRFNRFILHLSVADLIVTFVMLPLEIGWHVTVSWRAGDAACRILMFFRAFGFYLSSMILVTISVDRYFAILHPLRLNDAEVRGRVMLTFAWLFSIVASVPQSVIFHVETHPRFQWFRQCVTFNFFPSPGHELAYNLFTLIAVYGLPLIVIIIAYSLILVEMTRKTQQSKEDSQQPINSLTRDTLRRSGIGHIQKARLRTLKMTVVIVSVFILCWTPYFLISAWWWFDRKSADNVNPMVQRGLFLFAVSNSCADPIVYGMFTGSIRKTLFGLCCQRRQRDAINVREQVPCQPLALTAMNGLGSQRSILLKRCHSPSSHTRRDYSVDQRQTCFINSRKCAYY
ncbi:hypothetical protein LSH36_742g00007 [Paralvinella palmiformis]|uniref:G-protein coupled receptors family 1 profile domain-containing protein n=1 Tax=Paralvinella palmiformis TaxID=53620 RepID=A0AAD9J1W9_9ANNE|nr:hypothetical protein LSH36_742g00007 [Paralvinella palmiformis]